ADRPLRLRFEEPTDHKFTLRDAVSDESKDSDPNTSSGSSRGLSETFVADRGSDEHQNIDAGLWAPGTVTAFVWDDRDGDGIQDSGERNGAGLSGITVSLTEENGTVLISNSTGANGQVTFSNVPADRPLRLRFEEPMNYKLTIRDVGNDESKDSDPNTSSGSSRGLSETFVADRGSDEHLNIDAGLWAPGTVTAFVWDDRDGDGIQDSGERNGAGLSGVNVELTEEDGTTILASATTEADGRVSFNNVPADRPLRLRFTELAFHKFTIRDVGNDESKDSDPNTSSGSSRGLSETFAADRGSDDHQNIDAGLWAPGTVIAFVWEDLDGDGIQDSGERSSAGIDGVIVELLETNDQVFDEVVTTNNGQAIFEDVPADRELRLRFTEPSGYTFTTRFAGSDGSRDSDANTSGGSSLGKSQTFAADRGSDEITHIDAGLVSNGGSILVGSRENVTSTVSPFANDEIEAISEGQLTTGLDFRPGLTPAEVQINSIEELTLFPVPANDRLNVMFTLAKQQEAVYSILDQSGRVLRTERRDLASGINRIDLDVFQLPAGSYYFQLRTADQVLNKSFLIVR
ncbi:MAG: SdrD B-like domain-containing protein, partial [Bacteroidota bacterium]